jgi:hypothetical protein
MHEILRTVCIAQKPLVKRKALQICSIFQSSVNDGQPIQLVRFALPGLQDFEV